MIDQPQFSDNLNTFRILYIIKGVMNLLGALFFLLYVLIGNVFMSMPEVQNDMDELPDMVGALITSIGLIGFAVALSFAIVTLLAAKYLNERRNSNFIFIAAILNCLTGILGILLGVFTIIELNKPHVKELFQQHPIG